MTILTVDIGNTTIALAIVKKGIVKNIWHVDTALTAQKLNVALSRVFKIIHKQVNNIEMVVICSVVPESTHKVERFIHNNINSDIFVVGRDIHVPLKNCYKNPQQVGQDRLVGAFAAFKLYGKPLIVIDLGTAITFDAINTQGHYLGGAIVPGLRLSAESLFLKTALLPKIAFKAPRSVIGQTTQDSILSGLFYGYGFLCQGFIQAMAKKLKGDVKVVMTGGHTHLMKQFIASNIRIIDEHLVHKGMYLLAQSIDN